MKLQKIFGCSCLGGFTGDFCEFKTEQDHLLFVDPDSRLVFNDDERLIEKNAVIDGEGDTEIYYRPPGFSCSTMLNGEAIIFGNSNQNHFRQVHLK